MSTRQKKSKAKRRQPTMRDLRVLREITEFDPNGIEVTHHRTVDTLGMMLESGAITSGMHGAGVTSKPPSQSRASITCRR